MKHKTLVCLALVMMLIAACASAQQLPSVNCFSPGLLKVNGLENSAVSIDAALTVENAMYARNLSVLQAMLDGTNFRVQADGKTGTLSIARGGETLMQAAVTTDGQGARVSLDGTVYNVATPDEAAQDDAADVHAEYADFGTRAADRDCGVAGTLKAAIQSASA